METLEEKQVLAEKQVLDLLEAKQYTDLRLLLETLNPADTAELLNEMPEETLPLIFRLLHKEDAAEVFVDMDPDLQELLIKAFSDHELKEVMDELYLDDTVDLIEEMPANVVKRILKNTSADTRKMINEILQYPKDSAGSIMTTEYVDLKKDMTVEDAFKHIRETGLDKETIYTCYVTEADRKILGLVTVKTLLLSANTDKISDIMETKIIYANTLDDKEDVVKQFDKYDFLALPVVDTENRLVGIVTVDDAMDVMQEENTEDFAKMAAMAPIEDSYFKTSTFRHARNRILWLMLLMLSATLSGSVINHYETALQSLPVLMSFIPMLMGTGGNSGSQSSTIVIRGLALDDIKFKDFFSVIWKEARIAILCSVALAVVNFVRVFIFYDQDVMLALTVSLSIICTVVLAKVLGSSLPLLMKKIGLDPALMAAPVLTTILDTCSILIFFNISNAILSSRF